MPTWRLDRLAVGLLTEQDVLRAHIAAPHVLASWEARDARHWRGVFLGLGLGAVLPLAGCLLLDWPPGVLVVALTLDVVALWLGEALKGALAYLRVAEERTHHEEAADVLAVIEGLERPTLPPRRDLLAPRPRARLHVSRAAPREDNPLAPWLGLLVGGFFAGVCGLIVAWMLPAAAPWLLGAATLRLGITALRALRARRDSASRPELLGEAALPTVALMLSLYPAFILIETLDIDLRAYDARTTGALVLGGYFLVAGALAWRGWARVQAAGAALRAFIARDREQMLERVRQVNG